MRLFTICTIFLMTQDVFAAGISIDSATGIDMDGSPVTNLSEPEFPNDAATKDYLDRFLDMAPAPAEKTDQTTFHAAAGVGIGIDPTTGIDMGGSPVTNLPEPEFPSDAATKAYIDRLLDVAPAPVEKTGQSTSYATGDDGASQKGVAWPNPRFTDNEDGTVTDNLTRLIWLTKANCIGSDYPNFDNDDALGDGAVIWSHALDFVAGLNAGTYSCGDISNQADWRLPNIKELHSLMDFSHVAPALSNAEGVGHWTEGDAFSGVQAGVYWSATTTVTNTGDAWIAHFTYGNVVGNNKLTNHYVWPVRE